MTNRSWALRPSWSTSAAMPAAALSTAHRRPSSRLYTSSRILLTSISITRSIPCPHLVCGLAPTNRSGSEEPRGRDHAERRAQSLGSFRSPTPRAHPVHGVGAPTSCHIPARQGSFGRRTGHDPCWRAGLPAAAPQGPGPPPARLLGLERLEGAPELDHGGAAVAHQRVEAAGSVAIPWPPQTGLGPRSPTRRPSRASPALASS